MLGPGPFTQVDEDATIVFGADAVERAAARLGDGYVLLTTARAEAAAPAVVARAAAVVHVPPGQVHEVAAALIEPVAEAAGEATGVPPARLVALGGGRVIDVAKALSVVLELPGPVAIPTTLSAAEMSGRHRHAVGVDPARPTKRATLVVNDPALSASQPRPELAASSGNALAHAIAALAVERSTPIARAVAADAVRRFAAGWTATGPAREEIALAALLAGWAVDRSGLGPHHALSQTAVRVGGVGHAAANTALLPHTYAALRERTPAPFDALDATLPGTVAALVARIHEEAGGPSLAALTSDAARLERAVETAAARPELRFVAPALGAEEVRALYLAAGGS